MSRKIENQKPKNIHDIIKAGHNANLISPLSKRAAHVEVYSKGMLVYTYYLPPMTDPGTVIRGILESQGRNGSSLVRYNRDTGRGLVVDVVTETVTEEHRFNYEQ
jgi:hypothetical protein